MSKSPQEIQWTIKSSGSLKSKCGSFFLMQDSQDENLYMLYDLRIGYPQHPSDKLHDAIRLCDELIAQKRPRLTLYDFGAILFPIAVICLIIYLVTK